MLGKWAFSRGYLPQTGEKSSEQPADRPGRVIDHRDDPAIIQPGRSDHPENPDDPLLAIAIGRNDERRPGKREQLVLGADEDPHSFAGFRQPQQADHLALLLEVLE